MFIVVFYSVLLLLFSFHYMRKVLVTGSDGFLGQNLVHWLEQLGDFAVKLFGRGQDIELLTNLVREVDLVIHLAGVNRPKNEAEFIEVNYGLTLAICDAIRGEFRSSGRQISLYFASSSHASGSSSYGVSKRLAEQVITDLANEVNNICVIFRFPGIFGKWCRPNYNSVVATFCFNVAHGLPIQVDDPHRPVHLAYVDDVVTSIISSIRSDLAGVSFGKVREYSISLGELAEQIRGFERNRLTSTSERVGAGFLRALYATYISYLPPEKFSYPLVAHRDQRGVFVEMLKTRDSGQFGYITVRPGYTRGGHYHHTKSEKFLVVKGTARIRFRHLLTDELVEIRTHGDCPEVVDTIPGWVHDITNLGEDEMIVVIWANEIFDQDRPDTFRGEVV